MNEHLQPDTAADDEATLEALSDADPQDAPDIAEGLATSLQRDLDQTSGPGEAATESSS
jgi:hypothetical protein